MHDHPHTHIHDLGNKRLSIAIIINLTLTVVQIIGGLISGSLALISDALHNFSDAGSLLIALVARRIANRPADEIRTFGYRRAETIGALINVIILLVIGFYLIFEAVKRLFIPEPVQGWIVVIVAGVAFVIDLATALLTYTLAKDNLNFKAAFIHNVTDALGSIAAMAAGAVIILYDVYIVDAIAAFVIAGYVLTQSVSMLKDAIRLLMASVPRDIELTSLIEEMQSMEHVEEVHHVHIWELDEHRRALEAHIVIDEENLRSIEQIKSKMKTMLHDQYEIEHSTLEFELAKDESNACVTSTHYSCK